MNDTPTMPLLVIEAEGHIIKSNFTEFDAAARQWLADINRSLRTDEDFDQAADDVKKAKQVEDMLETTHEAVLAKASTLSAELNRLSGLSEAMRDARLELSRQIDKAKADQKFRIVEAGLALIQCDPSMRPNYRSRLDNAAKGKRTLETISEAVRVAVATANDAIMRCKVMLEQHAATHGTALIMDRRTLETSDPVAVEAELRRRVEARDAEREKAKLREAAALAQQQAAEARAEAARVNAPKPIETPIQAPQTAKPDPATVTDLPWMADSVDGGPDPAAEITADQEWDEFKALVVAAFGGLRPARMALGHPANQSAAQAFAEAVNAAWTAASKQRMEVKP